MPPDPGPPILDIRLRNNTRRPIHLHRLIADPVAFAPAGAGGTQYYLKPSREEPIVLPLAAGAINRVALAEMVDPDQVLRLLVRVDQEEELPWDGGIVIFFRLSVEFNEGLSQDIAMINAAW